MHEYDEAVLKCFLKNQLQLLPEKVAENIDEAEVTAYILSIDDKTLCDFYFPSIVMQDDIVIGINSSGTDPKITKTVRKQIEEKINADTIYKE